MTEKLIVPKNDPKFNDRSCGVVQGISHDSLIELLKCTGYIRKTAEVEGLKIDGHGISFYLD